MTGAEQGAQGEGAPGQGEEAAAAWSCDMCWDGRLNIGLILF